jgi:hypothetical protein
MNIAVILYAVVLSALCQALWHREDDNHIEALCWLAAASGFGILGILIVTEMRLP